jgi:hypothetical protein
VSTVVSGLVLPQEVQLVPEQGLNPVHVSGVFSEQAQVLFPLAEPLQVTFV